MYCFTIIAANGQIKFNVDHEARQVRFSPLSARRLLGNGVVKLLRRLRRSGRQISTPNFLVVWCVATGAQPRTQYTPVGLRARYVKAAGTR